MSISPNRLIDRSTTSTAQLTTISAWKSKGGTLTNRAQQAILRNLCGDWKQEQILEVGPGTARFTIPLLQQGNCMTLLDISTAMLSTAKKHRGGRFGEGVLSYLEGSIYELPFEDCSFDHALSLNVLNHLERPGEALKQLSRVVRPGSTLLFNYANLHSYYWPTAHASISGRRRLARMSIPLGSGRLTCESLSSERAWCWCNSGATYTCRERWRSFLSMPRYPFLMQCRASVHSSNGRRFTSACVAR